MCRAFWSERVVSAKTLAAGGFVITSSHSLHSRNSHFNLDYGVTDKSTKAYFSNSIKVEITCLKSIGHSMVMFFNHHSSLSSVSFA